MNRVDLEQLGGEESWRPTTQALVMRKKHNLFWRMLQMWLVTSIVVVEE